MRIVLRHRDQRVVTGYATAFDPKDGSVMVSVSPGSPAASIVSLDIVEVLVLEPTDGKPLAKRIKGEPSPGKRSAQRAQRAKSGARATPERAPVVRVEFADGRVLIGADGAVDDHGVWMRPPDDAFSRVFIPRGAARYVELLDDEVDDTGKMWAFLNDSTPTDEVEVPTGPTDVNAVISRED